MYCPTCRNEVFTFPPIKRLVSTTVKSAKPAATFWIFLLRTKNRQLCCLAGRVHIVSQERRIATTKKKSHLHFWNFSANQFQAKQIPHQKRLKWVQLWNERIRFLLVDDLSNIFNFQIILFNFNLQSTATQLTVNLQKIMIFSVANGGVQWTLNFGPDSGTIAVIDLVQNTTISSQELPLAAWHLLLSQRQDFLDNHLSRVPITQNQEGTMEMRDQVLSGVRAQDLDTSSYQVSDRIHRVQLGKWSAGFRRFQTRHRHPFFSNIWRSVDVGIISWKPHCVGWRTRQRECFSINTRVCQTPRTSQVAEKSRFWSKNRKCTRLYFYQIVSISITVFAFWYKF